MSEKDTRGYVNPYVPGGLTEASQRAGMSGKVYVEDREGKQIAALVASIRKGTVVEVHELFYLAPATGRPQRRRRILGERVDAIIDRGGAIVELSTGKSSKRGLFGMSMRAHEQIATSGRARKHNRPGRQPKWVFTKAEQEVMMGLWTNRKFQNDAERALAIQQRIGKSITRAWLRRAFGSPHGR